MSDKHEDAREKTDEQSGTMTGVLLPARKSPTFRAIEEHAATMKVSAPVLAAVCQSEGWAAGKSVEKTEFERAVNGFLGSGIGGR